MDSFSLPNIDQHQVPNIDQHQALEVPDSTVFDDFFDVQEFCDMKEDSHENVSNNITEHYVTTAGDHLRDQNFEAKKEEELESVEVVDLRDSGAINGHERENHEDEQSIIGEATKRMKYERKFSASLYAFNGISQCLMLNLDSKVEVFGGDQRVLEQVPKFDSNIDVENKNKDEKEPSQDTVQVQEQAGNKQSSTEIESFSSSSSSSSLSSVSSGLGFDLHLWSSLNLSPSYF
ncbi:hypothetical protein L484_015706 [Morus notabilis]|uniref:Uncharacterized protein n=1 Tax=Morus notabilis TaxID=981085 RepID=W9S0E4_9ROSA|nr:hypothetical protein L484_015706 [Morus notabilis]